MLRLLQAILIACGLCVAALSGTTAYGQNPAVPAPHLTDYQSNGAFALGHLDVTEFGDPTVIRSYGESEEGEWRELGRIFRHFTAPGQPDTVMEQVYDQIEQRWRFTVRRVYGYDARQRIVRIQYSQWDFGSDDWQAGLTAVIEYVGEDRTVREVEGTPAGADTVGLGSRTEFTYSDSEPNKATVVSYFWRPASSEWAPSSRQTYTASDSSVVEIRQFWPPGEDEWQTAYRYTYPGVTLSDVLYALATGSYPPRDFDNVTEYMQARQWQPTHRVRTTYTPEGLPSARIEEYWLWSDRSWQAYYRIRYESHSGRISDAFSEYRDEKTGGWTVSAHSIFSYDPIRPPDKPDPIPNFRLLGNLPNPFGSYTRINYVLKTRTHVTLRVYDVLGREVDTLVDGVLEEGSHTAYFDATRLPNGTYFYVLTSPSYREARAMTLINGLPTIYQFAR